jgi:glycosyltransferase involved in cell wall biosynthesis
MFLTVAIPTYNRVEYLRELLPEIIQQCSQYDEVEILVGDNCTTDATEEYLHSLNGIRFYRNKIDIGGDLNFVRLVENSRSKYVWLFGDDEILMPRAIDTVLALLMVFNPSLMIVGEGNTSSARYFSSYSEFIKKNTTRDIMNHSLITCNIFRKSVFNCNVARQYTKTRYGHMYALASSLLKGGDVYKACSPIIKVREERPPFAENVQYVRTNQIRFLRYLGISYPRVAGYATGLAMGTVKRRLKL